MTLASYDDSGELYLTRGDEVKPNRPLFTGDVFLDVAVPGVQDGGLVIVVAHPCSLRGAHPQTSSGNNALASNSAKSLR